MNNQAQGNNAAGLSNDQLQQLNQRFRCKADLYKYMDRVIQIYLPKQKNCSIQVGTLPCSIAFILFAGGHIVTF